MAYAAFSVVYGEQPSAAKWNILGTNDSSFNDGTGIGNGVITQSHLAATVIPPGQIIGYAGSSAPSGWFLCDGSAISRSTYSALFAIVSTLYGVGDGSTTFNLPNLQGRVAVGKNSATFLTLGQTGGAETHTLSTSELAVHNHGWNAGQQFVRNVVSGGQYTNTAAGSTWVNATPTGSIDNAGGNSPHNNIQPYQVINYLIKT